MNILVGIICFIVGAVLGFGLMYWVSIAMVDKVKLNEEGRHQALISQFNEESGKWQDIVNEILDEVSVGHLSNRSVSDQVAIVKKCIRRNE